jgi:peroxiredoxin Q/BCP
MKGLLLGGVLAGALVVGSATTVAAQAAAALPPPTFLPVGTMAPDIEVEGATRHGVLALPVRLSELRGETVVLAFFFRVRGGG